MAGPQRSRIAERQRHERPDPSENGRGVKEGGRQAREPSFTMSKWLPQAPVTFYWTYPDTKHLI